MLKTVLLSTLWFSSVLFAADAPSTQSAGRFNWTNPLSPNLRDPQITFFDGIYYLTGTAAPFFEKLGPAPGVKIWTSHDLLHWDDGTLVVTPSTTQWYQQRFWAPELYHSPDDGKFYLTFNCPKGGKDANTAQAIGIAVADRPLGPYRVVTEDQPLAEGNDASVFRDDDGKTYIFRSGLNVFEVDLPNLKVVGQPFDVIAKQLDGAWDGGVKGAPAVGLEGPSVIKIGKTYYCFYSSWGRGYEVGYATADNIRGPWTRSPNNPIYGAQDEAWAKRYKHEYTQPPGSPYRQVGHNSTFTGPDGKLWISAHAYRVGDKTGDPHLVIDPLHFENGQFLRVDPTYSLQSVRITAR